MQADSYIPLCDGGKSTDDPVNAIICPYLVTNISNFEFLLYSQSPPQKKVNYARG